MKVLLVVAFLAYTCIIGNALPSPVDSRIVGGTDAAKDQFPYQVSIQTPDSRGNFAHYCGGTLYQNNKVLTSATCVDENFVLEDLQIVSGELDVSDIDGTEQIRTVSKIKLHPNYNGEDYNIAVVTLSSAFTLNSHVALATLPAQGSDPASGTATTVSGFGAAFISGGGGYTTLSYADVSVVARTSCTSLSGALINDRVVCAAGNNKGICRGDTGTPLALRGTSTVVGVASWGGGTGGCKEINSTYPDGYTRVGFFVDWINNQ